MAESPRPDLAETELPLTPIVVGTRLFRMVRRVYGEEGALHFGSAEDPRYRSRWYSPDGSYGVGFFGFVARVCFLETLLRNPHQRFVAEAELRNWLLVELEVTGGLHVVRLQGRNLRRVGCTAAVVSGPHAQTWPLSKALHDHPDAPAGIMHPSRMDSDDATLALFDRARGSLRTLEAIDPTDPTFEDDLGKILERYDIGLV